MLRGELERLRIRYPKKALVGTIDYSHNDYVQLRKRFDSIIVNRNSQNLSFSERAEAIALGCVLFAGIEHNDSQYWEVLANYFQKTVPQLREIIIPYLRHYFSVMGLPVYSRTRNEYVETIKMHAIIPNNKLGSVVQAFYLMYIKDLRHDVSNEMVQELNRFLLELFQSNFEEEKVQDDFQGSKMSEIRQLLPMSFQKAYITNPRAVSKIVHGFLRYFDSVYQKEPYQGSLQKRFKIGID
ncbi:hypothetical protein [Jeotgalibaca caeni]|uniref:hypothetical protein n=1 Tax=Jeotgalibaca caeni TaxID=3028623 RepID=UPI00237E0F07|nr:hypothetical protein [Jeotgalibaca caeni]MDE1547826.1 hypothetical protein [Jeotgalibaca caeni]